MATTVAQHTVATFTSPVNGTTPIDANTVRGNDNTTRVAYNDHDSDPGIHVQSSTLASRPVAGTAGRKWITDDSGIYTLWFDDGTNWHPVSSENVAVTVLAGETLAKGDVVKVTGWNNGQDLAEVVKTTSASDTAFAVMTAAVSSGTMGYATNTGIVQDVNTAAYSVGTVLYANGSGGFTSTKPTSGHYQPVAYVLRANASNGVYYVEFSAPRIVERSDNTASTVVLRDASGNFSAGTITATAVNATTLDLTNLEVTNIKAKDGTQAIAIADVTGVTTFSAVVGATLSTAAQPNITSVGTLSSLTVSGDLTVDTNTLKVDSTNNRVGIGTASPEAQFVVSSSVANGEGGYIWLDNPSTSTVIGARAGIKFGTSTGASFASLPTGEIANVQTDLNNGASALTFSTFNGSAAGERMRLDASGNLGVGTTNPQSKLHVYGATATTLRVDNGDNAAAQTIALATGGVNRATLSIATSSSDLVIKSEDAGGRSNGIQFWTGNASAERMTIAANGNLAVDTNTLYVDATNNRVGVGTASPASALEVNGAARLGADGASVSLYSTTGWRHTGSGGLYIDANQGGAANSVVIRNGSGFASQFELSASGNLGLGVTPSAYTANTRALQMLYSGVWSDNWNLKTSLAYNAFQDTNTTYKYIGAFGAGRYDITANGGHQWFTAPSGTAGNAITFTQAMTLDANGVFMVGTANAGTGHKLRVGDTNGTLNYGAPSSGSGRLQYEGGPGNTFYIDVVNSGGAIAFRTENSGLGERARIDASGNLGIGTASPAGRLHVSGADATRIGLIAGATRAVRIGADTTAAYVEGVDQTGVASYQPLYVGGSTVNLFVSAAEKLRVDGTATAGQTALLLYDVDNGTLERVTVGAADSGGTGFKVLRIPN